MQILLLTGDANNILLGNGQLLPFLVWHTAALAFSCSLATLRLPGLPPCNKLFIALTY